MTQKQRADIILNSFVFVGIPSLVIVTSLSGNKMIAYRILGLDLMIYAVANYVNGMIKYHFPRGYVYLTKRTNHKSKLYFNFFILVIFAFSLGLFIFILPELMHLLGVG